MSDQETNATPLSDEQLGALLLVRARAQKKSATLTAQLKASSAALLKLADALSADPDAIAVKGLPPGLEEMPTPRGRKIEFDWAQIDTVSMMRSLIELREAQAEDVKADEALIKSGQV